jgi:Hemerythrin HHE cation binding domain
MIDVAGRAGTGAEPTSSGGLRNAILSRHDELRGLLAETVGLAGAKARAGSELDALRARARRLYRAFEDHLTFEEQAFPQALRDVIGWGPALQEQIEEEHTRQRLTIATALSALEPETQSWGQLASDVQAFAAALLRDIEQEEEALLNADLDAIATDSEGG